MTNLHEEFLRFKAVVAARTTGQELVDLVGKLRTSEKFSHQVKPECFVFLLTAACKKVPDKLLPALVAAINQYEVMQLLYSESLEETVYSVSSLLVKRVLMGVPRTSDDLMSAILSLEAAIIMPDRSFLAEFSLQGGIPLVDLEEICDLTYKAYYHLA